MKKLNSLDYLLSLGIIILQIAGYSLADNALIESGIIKSLIIFIIAVLSYTLSYLFKSVLKVDISSKVAYALASFGILNSFIILGAHEVFGKFFSFSGEGALIFFASIFILIGVLAILTIVIYKNYKFIHLAYLASIGMIISLLVYFKVDYYALILIINVILFILNLFNKHKLLYEFSSIALIVTAGLSVFAYDNNILLTSILFLVNIISLFRVLSLNKNFEYELLSSLVLAGIVLIYSNVLLDALDKGLSLMIPVFVVLTIDLVLSVFRIIDDEKVKVIYKIGSLICLASLMIFADFNPIVYLVVIAFILITSIVNIFFIHNNDCENYILPFKIMFITYYIIRLMPDDSFVPLAFSVQAILFALTYKLFNKGSFRIATGITLVVSLFIATCFMDKSMIINIVSSLSLFIVYLLFNSKKDDVISNVFHYAFLIILTIMNSTNSLLEVLFIIIVLGFITFIKRNNKVCFSGSIFVLIFIVDYFLSLSIKNYDVYLVLSYLMMFLLSGIAIEILFDNSVKSKNIFSGILFGLVFLSLLFEISDFITTIFALISSLVIVLISLKNDGYKSSYTIGFIFSILYLIKLLNTFDKIPASIYLLITSLVLIIIASVMIYRYQHDLDKKIIVKKAVKKVYKDEIHFCSECGSKVGSSDLYCGECGKKVR